jgi:hypothetical protein
LLHYCFLHDELTIHCVDISPELANLYSNT